MGQREIKILYMQSGQEKKCEYVRKKEIMCFVSSTIVSFNPLVPEIFFCEFSDENFGRMRYRF